MKELINQLKENDQDFEFYPTTKEMIKCIYDKSDDIGNVLDIGCGICGFKRWFKHFSNIEKDEYKRNKIHKYYVI